MIPGSALGTHSSTDSAYGLHYVSLTHGNRMAGLLLKVSLSENFGEILQVCQSNSSIAFNVR